MTYSVSSGMANPSVPIDVAMDKTQAGFCIFKTQILFEQRVVGLETLIFQGECKMLRVCSC